MFVVRISDKVHQASMKTHNERDKLGPNGHCNLLAVLKSL